MPGHRWHPVCPIPHELTRPARSDPRTPLDHLSRVLPAREHSARPPGTTDPGAVRETPARRRRDRLGRVPTAPAALIDGLGRDGRTPLPIPLALGHSGNIRTDDLVVPTYERLDAGEVVARLGIPCVDVLRATFDAMRLAGDDREAVVVTDMMAAAERVSMVRMRDYIDTHAGWQDIDRVRRAMTLAREHSRSPNPTRLRLIWVLDAGLPPDVHVNCPVRPRRTTAVHRRPARREGGSRGRVRRRRAATCRASADSVRSDPSGPRSRVRTCGTVSRW